MAPVDEYQPQCSPLTVGTLAKWQLKHQRTFQNSVQLVRLASWLNSHCHTVKSPIVHIASNYKSYSVESEP